MAHQASDMRARECPLIEILKVFYIDRQNCLVKLPLPQYLLSLNTEKGSNEVIERLDLISLKPKSSDLCKSKSLNSPYAMAKTEEMN